MNTLLAGFIGPQEIIIILFFFLIIPFALVVFLIVRAIRKTKKTNSPILEEDNV